MKRTLLICFYLTISLCKAQTGNVAISDTNFRAYLSTLNPNLILQDSLLNTDLSSLITTLDCSSNNIYTLDGLEYFTNLDSLTCSYNPINVLGELPESLEYLDCSHCINLNNIPNIPHSLKYLDCSYNQIQELPILPVGLKKLFCAVNNITEITYLPQTLNYLDCSFNNITEISYFPQELIHINCSYNNLTRLPNLPSELGLTYNNPLNIFNNNIECVGNYTSVFSELLDIYESCEETEEIVNLNLEFEEGWSIFTLKGNTGDMDVDSVFSSISPDNIIIIKDNDGNPYLTDQNYNGIGDLEVGKAYQIKTSNSFSFNKEILKVYPETNSLELSEGWNLIGYIRDSPANAELVLKHLTENNKIQFVKNALGHVYIPSIGYNGIGNFNSGHGYQIKVNEDCFLHFLPNEFDY